MDIAGSLHDFIKTMPSLPTSVNKILEVCNDPNTSPADLNHVVSLDPILVGRVLKLVNSAYFRAGQPVTSLARAMVMLGMNTVKNLALSTAIIGFYQANYRTDKSKDPSLSIEGLWRHSLCVGIAAKLLARIRGIDVMHAEEYFAAGLLHDLGKVALNGVLAKNYLRCIVMADREGKALHEAEEGLIKWTHSRAGALIVDAWSLHGPVGDVIIHHHDYADYSGEYRELLYTVAVANYYSTSSRIGFSGNRHPQALPPLVWETLGIDQDQVFEDIDGQVHDEIEEAELFLRVG
ncbi:MAG: HDOD domain-containing protein [Treponema sp.]|nr:HDOD domain-containing protein [Treponema sp.]